MTNRKVAVVTGASSGIGRASARALAAKGYEVVCAARRLDRIEELAREIDGRAVQCDVTNREDVERLAAEAGPRVDVLVANAGGAFGTDPVASADLDDWRRMYEINVLGTLSTIQTTLPALEAAHGVIITIGSTAGLVSYEGGGGYCGVKHAVRAMMGSLRLELFDKPVRVCEIDPGMVKSDEFALVRFDGDEEKAAAVYAGVEAPLTQEDIADAVTYIAELPEHVNIDQMVVRPRAQAAQHKVFRTS
ncbi:MULTISPECIES: SDR family NAD(P)-dependent oxidoreductase [Dermacoccus]|jgi:NADP-dependent 3-hydroxy acid dehydrogenase YdfG|uniref:SDR family oxidoreductase n=3 Tax=Dermacoccus TaxID=57495 RepID=A0A417Z212_9MICO|nr:MULTISPECIES: SDR family oxidoreductase [Dermacoccus]KLO62240.1 oxidoreductase [Dermacoccus sp. PE3]MCT1987076.1 SDR family oxidoreductase [Dermacoccus abyssi]QNK53759.1 SDR family oxidoreductase [Dermacoccus sp. PAMC28757]RHW44700.1 SDR family oxidoreductase [Dermacoccus abyssi]RYI22406.1 SDR family oxidoreductase [Dermacoccus sp. 147Ba]